MLGQPGRVGARCFDLDGVLTPTALTHVTVLKSMSGEFLRRRSARLGEPFVPFDAVGGYEKYVDGRSRVDGTRSFLESRGVGLPEGEPGDPQRVDTVWGLVARKGRFLPSRSRAERAAPYPGLMWFLGAVRALSAAGLRRAVVSASRNCVEVLAAAGPEECVEVRVDGVVAAREGLAGKPAPDRFVAAAERLGVVPGEAVVFEDALAGVAAGRAGGFGLVAGVSRDGSGGGSRAHGVNIVVSDLEWLLEHS